VREYLRSLRKNQLTDNNDDHPSSGRRGGR
jgi:hypothetical protein